MVLRNSVAPNYPSYITRTHVNEYHPIHMQFLEKVFHLGHIQKIMFPTISDTYKNSLKTKQILEILLKYAEERKYFSESTAKPLFNQIA